MISLGPMTITKFGTFSHASLPEQSSFMDEDAVAIFCVAEKSQNRPYTCTIIDFLNSWTLFLEHFASFEQGQKHYFPFLGYSDGTMCRVENDCFCFTHVGSQKELRFPCWTLLSQSMQLFLEEWRLAALSKRLPQEMSRGAKLSLYLPLS